MESQNERAKGSLTAYKRKICFPTTDLVILIQTIFKIPMFTELELHKHNANMKRWNFLACLKDKAGWDTFEIPALGRGKEENYKRWLHKRKRNTLNQIYSASATRDVHYKWIFIFYLKEKSNWVCLLLTHDFSV